MFHIRQFISNQETKMHCSAKRSRKGLSQLFFFTKELKIANQE